MQNTKTNIFALTKQDTAVLKGIAIIAMLMHHLWGCPPAGVEPYIGVLGFLESVGKVCVAMFLFCSGYGLSVGYEKVTELKDTLKFLIKRLVKFYANYWVVFLVFVPITIFCFDRPLSAAYGESVNIPKRFLYDLLGLQGFQSYNITWWFNKLILIFYALYPVLYFCVRKFKWITLLTAFAILFLDAVMEDYGYMPYVAEYLFPFVVGITFYMYRDRLNSVSVWIQQHYLCALIGALVSLGLCASIRVYDIIPFFQGIRADALLTISILVLVVIAMNKGSYIFRFLQYAGIHSANIYLIHTFFNGYWPTVNMLHDERMVGGGEWLVLFALSMGCSILIEYLKSKLSYNKLVNKITSKI